VPRGASTRRQRAAGSARARVSRPRPRGRWSAATLIEQTERNLKALRESEPRLFEAKIKIWKQASWAFTTARFRGVTAKYREAIRQATRV
jgi:hypothetical protein